MRRKLIFYVTFLLACVCARAFAAEPVVLRGCVNGGGPMGYYLEVPGKAQVYKLTGNTAPLNKYVEREVRLEGKVNESTHPWPSFSVLDVKQVFEIRRPTLSGSFADSSLWKRETNSLYGISYAHPPSWIRLPDSEQSMVWPNFAANAGAIVLARYEMPLELYPKATLPAERSAFL